MGNSLVVKLNGLSSFSLVDRHFMYLLATWSTAIISKADVVIINKLESPINCVTWHFTMYGQIFKTVTINYIFMSVVTWSIFFQLYSPAAWVEKIYVVAVQLRKGCPV